MSYYAFLRNSTYRRYAIFILTLFFSVYTIQAWINYKSIQDSIAQAKQDILHIQEEIDYTEKRYKQYLHSDYAPYFLGHENGQLYSTERLVVLEYRKPQFAVEDLPLSAQDVADKASVQLPTPESSRHYFIQQKLQPLKELGIIK